MLLTPPEAQLFFKLHRTLMLFVNQRLNVLSDGIGTPEKLSSLSPELRLKVRDACLDDTDLIQFFVDQNPAHLPDDELELHGTTFFRRGDDSGFVATRTSREIKTTGR